MFWLSKQRILHRKTLKICSENESQILQQEQLTIQTAAAGSHWTLSSINCNNFSNTIWLNFSAYLNTKADKSSVSLTAVDFHLQTCIIYNLDYQSGTQYQSHSPTLAYKLYMKGISRWKLPLRWHSLHIITGYSMAGANKEYNKIN